MLEVVHGSLARTMRAGIGAAPRVHGPMKGSFPIPFGPRRCRMAIVCASVAGFLVIHHPDADAQPADATDAPPLVVFVESDARADQPPLSADAAAKRASIHADPAASDLRIGHSDPAAVLAARALSFAPPSAAEACTSSERTEVVFTDASVTHNEEGLVSLYARNDTTDAEIALVIQGPDVLGSIRCGDETYKFHPLGDGVTAVYKFDASQLRRHPSGWGKFMENSWTEHIRDWERYMHEQVRSGSPRRDPGTPDAAADIGDEVDILVAYTPTAARQVGNIDAFIQFAIDNTHRIYGNSNIELRLRLVHKHQVNYSEGPHMAVDLERLTFTPTDRSLEGFRPDPRGDMDEIHGLRDRYGADLVALIVGQTSGAVCGIAWLPDFGRSPNRDFADAGFSVIAQNCETLTYHSFAHEIGHNQGANHDPDSTCGSPPCTPPPPTFPYRHGRCNTAEGWRTTMSYVANIHGTCWREIEYFSSPLLNYRGMPTGDAARRDNRRVLLETASRVANFRQSKDPPVSTHTLPLVTPASNIARQGFVRIINYSGRAGEINLSAIDDDGRRFGPVSLSLQARAAVHLNSHDLENGNSGKGLSIGVGHGSGNWRLVLTTDLAIEPLAYIRTADGFVTNMHEVAAETQGGSNRYHVPFFNPGKNRSQVSSLRLINPGSSSVEIEITGVDDSGRTPPSGSVRLTLGAGRARMLDARSLENGGSGISGRFGAGEGKWRLSVSSDRPILVMSLLQLPTGHLTNLSRGWAGASALPGQPDLIVQSPSVSDDSLITGDSFRLRVTIHNQGTAQSARTRVRYYRSPDARITTTDTLLNWFPVSTLPAFGTSDESTSLTAPSSAGTYYYGACIDSVSGESDTRNNCSSAVRATVFDKSYGAIATGIGSEAENRRVGFYVWGAALNYPDRNSAISNALAECGSLAPGGCGLSELFTRCGALAYGESRSGSALSSGTGATRSAAEQDALSECRADYSDCWIPVEAGSGTKASYCNLGAGAPSLAEAQSGSSLMDSPLGASK